MGAVTLIINGGVAVSIAQAHATRYPVAPVVLVLIVISSTGCTATQSTQAPSPTKMPASEEPTASPTIAPSLAAGVTLAFDLPFAPSGIEFDGHLLWAEDHAQTNAVYALDPVTGETVFTIDVDRPCDVVTGFVGSGSPIWIPGTFMSD